MVLEGKRSDLLAWKEAKVGAGKLITASRMIRALAYANRARYRDGRFLVINSLPKSGSTFLSNALAKVLGYEHGYAAAGYHIEQELDLGKLIDLYGRGVVIQQHFRANSSNIRLLSKFGTKPVILVRNIFDTIVSLRDHLHSEGLDIIPGLYPSGRYPQFNSEMQLDFLVEFYAPWLLSYYASWCAAGRTGEIDLYWAHYETASTDWVGAIENILDFYGLTASSGVIKDVVADMSMRRGPETRLNVGVTGRGSIELSALQQARISEMARFYPEVDFAPVGVPRSVEFVEK